MVWVVRYGIRRSTELLVQLSVCGTERALCIVSNLLFVGWDGKCRETKRIVCEFMSRFGLNLPGGGDGDRGWVRR